MKIASLVEATEALRPFIPNVQQTDWSFALEDMKVLLQELDNPQDSCKVIHVAGTSGKTSTSYYIAKMLQLSGKQVGLTISPHVDSLNERIQINGSPLSEVEFCELLGEFMSLPAVSKSTPSYFGLLVAFAFWVFARKGIDYAVVEVGMGGRLDATNTITRDDKIAVITDIGMDHTDMLGDTLTAIAGEKAGIIQPNNVVFSARQVAEVAEVIKRTCEAQHARLYVASEEDIAHAPKQLPLYQRLNWALARKTIMYVQKRDELVELAEEQWQASTHIQVPGRMEVFHIDGKTVITDGAHNAQKMKALVASIQAQYPNTPIAGLVSFVKGKDTLVDDCMEEISKVVSRLIVTEFSVAQDAYKHAIPAEILATSAEKASIKAEVITDNIHAIDTLLQQPEPVLLVTGSLYLLSQIRPLLKERANK